MFLEAASSQLASLFKKVSVIYVSAMNDEFAIAGNSIKKIVPFEHIHFLAKSVARIGNEIVPVFDIRIHPDIQGNFSAGAGQLLLLSIGNKSIGVLVSQVINKLRVDPLSVKDAGDAQRAQRHVQGKISVNGKDILLVDLIELLRPVLRQGFLN